MARLGPFGPAPRLGVAVSGGADSSALALLAASWAGANGGSIAALVVDHRLRAESAAESTATVVRLQDRGIAARRLVLDPPPSGPDISGAARAARFRALEAACVEAGIVFLLLGHTRADQAETVLWRGLRRSGPIGAAGMPARRETDWGVVLRPLLGIAPARLRATCRAAGLAWIEDPTNRDPRFARPRLRALLADPEGGGPAIAALAGAAARHGLARATAEAALAEALATHAELFPQGLAIVRSPAGLSAPAAQLLVRTVGGLAYPPEASAALALVRRGQGTLAGVQASPAGRFGPGIVLAREPALVEAPAGICGAGQVWDRRWRVNGPAGYVVGALGAEAVPGRERLPARLAAVLPAIRAADGRLLAVPALHFHAAGAEGACAALFAPPLPLAGPPFLPMAASGASLCTGALQGSAG